MQSHTRSRETKQITEEEHNEISSDVEEQIKQMMNKQRIHSTEEAAQRVQESDIAQTIQMMRQLSMQYDEIEGYLKRAEQSKDTDAFPIEVVGSFVKSTKISPTLINMITSMSEECKRMRQEIAALRIEEARTKEQIRNKAAEEKTKKLETKYLEQTVKDATKELRVAREEALAQRKRIIELETTVASQKQIAKELLREKTVKHKETEISEEEKSVLRRIIEEKESAAEEMRRRAEEAEYETKRTKRENEVLQIQQNRLKKRAEIKDKALASCNIEMERMIKQLDKLTKMDTQKKEKLEHMSIIKKRLEHENMSLQSSREGSSKSNREGSRESKDKSRKKSNAHTSIPQNTRTLQNAHTQEHSSTQSSQHTSEAETDIPANAMSFSQAIDTASMPSSESESSAEDRTTTSFRQMQKKTEEMAQKFRDLERLLQEIKKEKSE